MRFTKKLLQKSPLELTDEELKCIGAHFLKYPIKPIEKKPPLVRCGQCANLDMSLGLFYCNVTGAWLNKRNNLRQIAHWRRCEHYKKWDF